MNKTYLLICMTISFLVCTQALFGQTNKNEILNGVWKSTEKDLKVLVYNRGDVVYAKLIGFPYDHKTKKSMNDCLDYLNPDAKLRKRSWLDILILTGLKSVSKNKWSGGEIYNPHDGKTWSASVTLINYDYLEVRGYWGIALFGKSMFFKREAPSTLIAR